jgi:hypothetical protein
MDLIAQAVSRTPVADYIAGYEESRAQMAARRKERKGRTAK